MNDVRGGLLGELILYYNPVSLISVMVWTASARYNFILYFSLIYIIAMLYILSLYFISLFYLYFYLCRPVTL